MSDLRESDDAFAVVINGRTFVEMYAAQKLVQEARRQTRAEVLEEAADAVGEVGDHADVGAYINAIRALKGKP